MEKNEFVTDWGLPKVSIRTNESPVSSALLELADILDVSIAIPTQAEGKTITVEYNQADARIVLFEFANRMDLSVNYSKGVITFVTHEEEEKAFVVLRSGYIETQRYLEMMRTQLGDKAQVEQIDDRVIITAPQNLLTRAMEINRFAQSGADGWMLEVKVVTLTDSLRRDLGIDWNMGGSLTLSASDIESVFGSEIFVSAIAEATQTGIDAKLLDTANLYILEGTTSTLNRGQSIPIPRYITTIEGATNISGYDYIDTGFILSARADRVPNGVRLNLQPTISAVTGFVQEAPITQKSSITADVVVTDGDWIILSGLESLRDSNSTKTIPGMPAPIFGSETTEQLTESIILIIKATRVHSSQQTS